MALEALGCPWSGFSPAEVDFCEANLCSWIVEPANSASCIGYIIAGIVLIRLARRRGISGFLGLMGPMGIGIGVFSVALHGTMTRWGSFLDLTSMYLFAVLLVLLNVRRMAEERGTVIPARKLYLAYLVCQALLAFLQLSVAALGIPLFALLITATGVTEIYLGRTQIRAVQYGWFWATAVSFGVSFGVWALDLTRVVCAPDNHWFTGHSFWHFGNAVSIYTFFRFYEQFESPLSSARKIPS